MVSGGAEPEERAVGLLSMWVSPVARGRGVGDALVDEVVRWAWASDAARVVLDVRASNGPAIALYARHHFIDVGTATPPGDPHPERRMVRELAARPHEG